MEILQCEYICAHVLNFKDGQRVFFKPLPKEGYKDAPVYEWPEQRCIVITDPERFDYWVEGNKYTKELK